MERKRTFYCESAYVLGVIILAFGTALMEWADFGLSMVVAPAYLLHLKISEFVPFFSFGVAGYTFQALILLALSIVMRRVKISYILSFGTAFLYGVVLDAAIALVGLFPFSGVFFQHVFYVAGLFVCATGVALLLHTYLPPEAYDLTVKEISAKFNIPIGKTKTVYDLCSCILAIVLSLCFFSDFVGVKWGTILCTFLNGFLIGRVCHFLRTQFIWKDALPLRSRLE